MKYRVKPSLLPQCLFPPVGFRAYPPGDLRLTDQLGGKGVQLLFGNKYREDPHRQRNDQHSAEDKDTHIQISLAAL